MSLRERAEPSVAARPLPTETVTMCVAWEKI
jgi:hypothetical protein